MNLALAAGSAGHLDGLAIRSAHPKGIAIPDDGPDDVDERRAIMPHGDPGRAPSAGGAAVNHATDPRVDAYIDGLPAWQQAICRTVRELVHDADAEVVETIKRTNRPYFVLEGNICALLAAKDHVNVFLYDGGIVPDPEGVITGGHDNQTARTVAIRHGEAVNEPALLAILRQIIANNRAGGWRALKPRP
jgi:hypothetical protein